METNTELFDQLDKVFGINEQNHTKGEWVITLEPSFLGKNTAKIFSKSKANHIAFIGSSDEQEQLANAKLIAASPILLECIKDLLRSESTDPFYRDSIWQEDKDRAIKNAIKAVKKATK